MLRALICCAGLLLISMPAVAAPPVLPLDPLRDSAYDWRVFVRFEPHPLLTSSFREQILQTIGATLRAEVQNLGKVDVQELRGKVDDQTEPMLKEFLKSGWSALDQIAFRELTLAKTHFVLIKTTRSGSFRVESRQHDGFTGLPSPAVRVKESSSPETLGRLAGMTLAKDFGPEATITDFEPERWQATLAFRGGNLPGLNRFVKPGDILIVSAVREQTRPRSTAKAGDDPATFRIGQPRDFLLLKIDSEVTDGICRAAVVPGTRAAPLTAGRGILGFRALKVPTVEGPIQVRIVDQNGMPPPGTSQLQVRAGDTGYPSGSDGREGLELKSGIFQTSRSLRHLACVVVAIGTTKEVRFPVPVLEGTPHVLRVNLNETDANRASFELECEALRARAAEIRASQFSLVKAVSRLIVAGKNREAYERAKTGLDTLNLVLTEMKTELERLKKSPFIAEPLILASINDTEARLRQIQADRGPVEIKVAELKGAVEALGDPTRVEKEFRAKELTAQIARSVERGEIPEALEQFTELFEFTKDESVKERRAKLAAEWEPKNEEHRSTRTFIINKWRGLTLLAEFEENATPFKNAIEVLAKNDDRLGLRNALTGCDVAYVKLKDILDRLDPNSEVDRASVKVLQTVTESVAATEKRIRAAISKLESPSGGSEP
jgi:hypothetical protein